MNVYVWSRTNTTVTFTLPQFEPQQQSQPEPQRPDRYADTVIISGVAATAEDEAAAVATATVPEVDALAAPAHTSTAQRHAVQCGSSPATAKDSLESTERPNLQ